MENCGRDEVGRFTRGRVPTPEELQKKAEGIKKHFETFVPKARLREQNPYIFNAWRAMLYTQKGKKAGCSTPEWREFESFLKDVKPAYIEGYRFCRINCELPFSKENFMWLSPAEAKLKGRAKKLIYLDYKGEHLTIKEIALKYNVSAKGIAVRYHKYRDKMSVEEIIFGKRVARGTKAPKDAPTES